MENTQETIKALEEALQASSNENEALKSLVDNQNTEIEALKAKLSEKESQKVTSAENTAPAFKHNAKKYQFLYHRATIDGLSYDLKDIVDDKQLIDTIVKNYPGLYKEL